MTDDIKIVSILCKDYKIIFKTESSLNDIDFDDLVRPTNKIRGEITDLWFNEEYVDLTKLSEGLE